MKCNSCESEIDPKWRHAIDNNLCPFCGQLIMEESLKNLLSSARSILDELNNSYKNEFIEWAKKNYNLVYFEDQKQAQQAEKIKNIESNMKTHNVNDFFKRAEVKPQEKSDVPVTREDKIKSLAQKVKSASVDGGDDFSQLYKSEEDRIPADSEELERAKQLISATYGVSSDPDSEDIPEVVLDMAKLRVSDTYNNKDVAKLQQHFMKTQASREAVRNGGGKKSFTRAG